MKTTIKSLLLFCSLLLFAFTSCKKNELTQSQEPEAAKGNATLHFHTSADTNEVESYDEVYIMSDGRKISVALAQLYISNIQLLKADGSVYEVTGKTILKTMEVEQYTLGGIPVGNYKSIRFNVGLASGANVGKDSLLYKENMWFEKTLETSSLIYMNFQGKIDTSASANCAEDEMQVFVFKIGTDANLKTITMPDKGYTIASGQTQFIHITIDYAKLFDGINLKKDLIVNTTSDNNSTLSQQIVKNIPLMFTYE